MKKSTLLFCFLLALNTVRIAAQRDARSPKIVRCATMEAIEQSKKTNPAFAAELEKKAQEAETALRNYNSNTHARTTTLSGPVTIPVIVHVVDANPYRVTEEQIDYLLDRLNKDFSGLNPDSANGSPFYNVRGHSLIRFTRARRTPTGTLTNGIERKVGSVLIAGTTYQPIKHASEGGLDPWDITKYYNLWVGRSSGNLGIAPQIGVGSQTETVGGSGGIDGVCVDIEAFSNGCFSIPAYNLGRTSVHEIAHNFGLYHIFSGCNNGDDFGQLTTPGQNLPPSLLTPADDTPNQTSVTQSCPTGSQPAGCGTTPNPPGKMYQNFMDYTDDACYSMFTKGQVERMHYVLENFRSGYLTTDGAIPPASAPALDIQPIVTVSPGGSEFNPTTCVTATYGTPTCPGSFVPKVMIINNGSSTITSITGICTVNGVPSAPVTMAVTLLTGRTAVMTFPAVNLVNGNNTIVFTTSLPNGGVDQNLTNDVLTKTVTIAAPVAAPLTEGFESSTFPPINWTLTQLSGTGNWARVSNAAKTGSASAKFDNFNYNAGTSSALTTPPVTFLSTYNVATLSFHYAYRSYQGENDRLEVLVSTNCGTTWTSLWAKSGQTGANALATATASTTEFNTPTPAQWTQTPVEIDLTAYKNQTVQIQFRATSDFGNNLFLDDVNIFGTTALTNDAGITAINSPGNSLCGNSFTPQVTVRNFGTSPLTSVTVRSAIDPIGNGPAGYVSKTFTGLNVAFGATTTLTLDPVTGVANGNHFLRAYTDQPNGLADQQMMNDSLRKSFVMNVAITTFPVVMDFETAWTGTAEAPILPGSWTVANPDNLATWARNTNARKSGNASGWVNNYTYNAVGQLDYLRSPVVNFAGKDSAYMTFHYAYKLYAAADADTLEVVISSDCGATWTTLWKKGGADLATTGGTGTPQFLPTAAQWTTTPVFVNLDSYINSGNVMLALRNTNDFGQALFVDDINIVGKLLNDIDVALVSIIQPTSDVCVINPTPMIRVRNVGRLTITTLGVRYAVNGTFTPIQTFPLNLSRGMDTVLTLTPISGLTAGSTATIQFSTIDPNNVADWNQANDTLSKQISIRKITSAPLTEGFEDIAFPPQNWELGEQPVITDKWARTTTATASTGIGAAYMKNFNNTALNSIDYLTSPVVSFSASDSVFLKFDVSAATYIYPGSTALALDTLEVELSIDCGNTWSSVYKKWGTDLQTINSPNIGLQTSFFPNSKNQWRTDSINLTAYLAAGGNARFRFKNINNNGNNVFIDNISFASKTLTARIKQVGVTVGPNPVSGTLVIQHYLTPTTLRGIGLYNSMGQRLMYLNYTGNAQSYIPIDMRRFGAGMYTIKLEYVNKTVSERIIKQ